MSEAAFAQLTSQIEMLSYAERLTLLNKLVNTLHNPFPSVAKRNDSNFDAAFGLWKGRDISVDAIRQKAWGR